MKLLFSHGRRLAFIFITVAFPALVIFATLVPFGEVTDEPSQCIHAQAILSGHFVGHREPDSPGSSEIGAGFNVDPGMADAALTPVNGQIMVSAAALAGAYQHPWAGEKEFRQTSPLAIYAPIFYFPASIGIGVARLMGMEPYRAGLFARLFNVFTYLAIGVMALLVARHGRAVMLGVLLLPMSLNLAASLNQDGLIIASSVLAASLISRSWAASEAEDRLSPKTARNLAALTLFSICLVKPPYLPLMLIFLLPFQDIFLPGENATARSILFNRATPILVTTLCVAAWVAWTMATISEPSYFPPRPAGPLLPGIHPATFSHTDPLWQLRVLAANPLRIISMPVSTFIWNPLFPEMVGVFGWLDVIPDNWVYHLWYGVSAIIAIGAVLGAIQQGFNKQFSWARMGGGLFICLIIFAGFVAIYISQYLVWSNPGAARIEGPQGRYLLPLVPFLALALPEFKSARFLKWNDIINLAPAAAGLICLWEYPTLLLHSYYLH